MTTTEDLSDSFWEVADDVPTQHEYMALYRPGTYQVNKGGAIFFVVLVRSTYLAGVVARGIWPCLSL